jgi:tetratricopeptide (TPR) repeat protein
METEVAQLPLWQKAWAWFEANKRQTLYGAVGLAVVVLVVAFFLYHQQQADVAAGEALSNVALSQMTGGSRGDAADAYLKVAAAYPNSRAGARALLLAAGGLFTEGKYAEALTQFQRFGKEYNDSPFRSEALLGIAACLDAQGKASEAIAAYKDLIDRHPADQVLPQARFALGRLYEAQNQPELARNMFEEVERISPYSSMGREAGMRVEELMVKYPNLATPIVPPATNAAPLQSPKR